jgi:hypothetical protein
MGSILHPLARSVGKKCPDTRPHMVVIQAEHVRSEGGETRLTGRPTSQRRQKRARGVVADGDHA